MQFSWMKIPRLCKCKLMKLKIYFLVRPKCIFPMKRQLISSWMTSNFRRDYSFINKEVILLYKNLGNAFIIDPSYEKHNFALILNHEKIHTWNKRQQHFILFFWKFKVRYWRQHAYREFCQWSKNAPRYDLISLMCAVPISRMIWVGVSGTGVRQPGGNLFRGESIVPN